MGHGGVIWKAPCWSLAALLHSLHVDMDDDLDFGASVWSTTERLSVSLPPPTFSEPSPAPSSSQDGFDDFDEFGTPAETIAASSEGADDDFGDFGDFGEVTHAADVPAFDGSAFQESISTPRPSNGWRPLHVDPTSTRDDLQRQIDSILGPLWSRDNLHFFTDEPIRQSEGLSQVLVTRERYFFRDIVQLGLYLKSQIAPVVNCMICFYQRLSRASSP